MHLSIKPSSKIIKPGSLVDMVFKDQGFKKKLNKESPYYYLEVKDNITRTVYEVQIPFQIIHFNQSEPYYKIADILIHTRSPLMKKQQIPRTIIEAAKEKVNEAFSYLPATHKDKVKH